jgi:hypothetical protein
MRWCSGSTAGSMALLGATLATVESDGVIRGRDKKTGIERWQRAIVPSPNSPQPRGTDGVAPPVEEVWATGNSFLAEAAAGSGPSVGSVIAELDQHGDPVWTWSGPGAVLTYRPVVAQPYVVVKRVTTGAITTSQPLIFKLGSGGGVLGSLSDGSDPIELRPPKIYSENDRPADLADSSAFVVTVGDLRPGIEDIDWRYQPDRDENEKLPFSGTHCCGLSFKRVGIENQYVYGSVGEHVYRYDLAAPDGQRPILMSDSGMFVAGPYENRIYVGRQDGVWSISFNGRYSYQLLVVPYRLPTVLADITFARGIGYAALTDGHVFAFEVDGGQPTISARISCSQFAGISVTQTRVLYACSAPSPGVYAFPR